MIEPGRVSILIPSRFEEFLLPTITDLLSKARGDVEVIVGLDGYWPTGDLPSDPRLIWVHLGQPAGTRAGNGMRPAIEAAAACARGEYLMKIDAHCLVAEGFDLTLVASCHEKNWVLVPRRYSLNPDTWTVDRQRTHNDYHYLCFPYRDGRDLGLHGEIWRERTQARDSIRLDDEMSSQGSCWFMHRDHFFTRLGGMPEEGYGPFVQEFQQVGLKTWLGGGAVKIVKDTFYAHLHKGTRGRGYFIDKRNMVRGALWSLDFWMGNRWTERVHDLSWLVEKFWPVPTWPEDRSLWGVRAG